jgi:hypothetical protein
MEIIKGFRGEDEVFYDFGITELETDQALFEK